MEEYLQDYHWVWNVDDDQHNLPTPENINPNQQEMPCRGGCGITVETFDGYCNECAPPHLWLGAG